MLVPWQKEFELGRPNADAEHREVVDLLNQLDVCLGEGDGAELDRVLADLSHLLASHLEREKARDTQVLDSLNRLGHGLARNDLRALAYWWLNHMCQHHGVPA